jgi:hypothetical protein
MEGISLVSLRQKEKPTASQPCCWRYSEYSDLVGYSKMARPGKFCLSSKAQKIFWEACRSNRGSWRSDFAETVVPPGSTAASGEKDARHCYLPQNKRHDARTRIWETLAQLGVRGGGIVVEEQRGTIARFGGEGAKGVEETKRGDQDKTDV